MQKKTVYRTENVLLVRDIVRKNISKAHYRQIGKGNYRQQIYLLATRTYDTQREDTTQ